MCAVAEVIIFETLVYSHIMYRNLFDWPFSVLVYVMAGYDPGSLIVGCSLSLSEDRFELVSAIAFFRS